MRAAQALFEHAASAAAATAAAAAAPVDAAVAAPPPLMAPSPFVNVASEAEVHMTPAEAIDTAMREGLELKESDVNNTGYANVQIRSSVDGTPRYCGNVTRDKRSVHLGSFDCAEAAALAVARHRRRIEPRATEDGPAWRPSSFRHPNAPAPPLAPASAADEDDGDPEMLEEQTNTGEAASPALEAALVAAPDAEAEAGAEAEAEPMTEAAVWEAAHAEGLLKDLRMYEDDHVTRGVAADGSELWHANPSHPAFGGERESLGWYRASIEAALHVARFLNDALRQAVAVAVAEEAAAKAAAPAAAAETSTAAMTAVQAAELALREGLVLLRDSDPYNETGYHGVERSPRSATDTRVFRATSFVHGRFIIIGRFATKHEAALAVARYEAQQRR